MNPPTPEGSPDDLKPGSSFADVVVYCAEQPELVREFNRLTGRNFGRSLIERRPRSAIEALVDQACGFDGRIDEDPGDVQAFIWFVFDAIWTRLPPECFLAVETAK